MFDIIHKKRPQAGENTNERFPSDMLSLRDSSACVHEYKICTRAGDQSVLLKYQISGLGVTRAFRERRKKLSERKRERQSVVAPHANFARGREKREKERAVLIMKKSSGSSFQNLQGTVNFVSSRSGVLLLLEERERKHNCASPSDDNLFYDWGVVFFFVFFFVCALFRSRLFAFARKQRKR